MALRIGSRPGPTSGGPERKPGRRKRHTHKAGHPPGSGGTEAGGGTTTTTDETGIVGSPELTSASTTAPVPADNTAQMTDEAEAFFGSGHGPALHYDRAEQTVSTDGTAQGGM